MGLREWKRISSRCHGDAGARARAQCAGCGCRIANAFAWLLLGWRRCIWAGGFGGFGGRVVEDEAAELVVVHGWIRKEWWRLSTGWWVLEKGIFREDLEKMTLLIHAHNKMRVVGQRVLFCSGSRWEKVAASMNVQTSDSWHRHRLDFV